ncbi:RICIN domain-containing protein [Dactylosporangium sp. NBC_01737]|uniref:RICIN domain-containing protein n=1 Tax=Dactylosporangium sp. NBC_01737 TaxID=2975959 RepID=UPI002E120C96|nr:RICIN domain-containing protein [Dactylosporangium sp. NBC_01737]
MAVATVGVLVLSAITSVVVVAEGSSGNTDAVPLGDAERAALIEAATSCPDLTPARLAGQIMATTRFEATKEGGIAGLTAAEWEIWKPSDDAMSSDDSASILALAHLTCDLIGRLRRDGFAGDLWPLAVAAFATSLDRVRTSAGVPADVADFVNQVATYAAWYGQRLPGGAGGPSTGPDASPSTSTSTSAPASASPTPGQTPSATPSITPSTTPSASQPTTPPAGRPTGISAGGTGRIRGLATGRCVDSDSVPAVSLNGTPMGGHAFSSACDTRSSQQWREGPPLDRDEPGEQNYRLLNQQTGFCLDSNRDGAVYTLPCLNPDSHQLWQRVPVTTASTSAVAYHNRASGRCLSLEPTGSTLRTVPCPTDGRWPNTMLFQRVP